MNIFIHFEVLELMAKPPNQGKRLPEYEQDNWKGDIDRYYEPNELDRKR